MVTAVVPIFIEVSSCLLLPPNLLPLYISSSHTSTTTRTTTATATASSGGCNTDSIARSSPGVGHPSSNFPHVGAQVLLLCQIAATIKVHSKK